MASRFRPKAADSAALLAVQVHHNYMALQRDVTAQMRSILVDWLVEVAQEVQSKRVAADLE